MSRKILLPIAAIALSGLVAFVLLATAPEVESVAPEETLPIVRAMPAHPTDVRMQVRSQGTVAPRTESELVPEVSGPVTWVSPALVSGGFFSLGDALLRIDSRDYAAALARARADVARAEGEAEHAAAELKRQQGLARSKANSPSQLSNARRGRRVADATLEAAKVSLDQAGRDLKRTEIVAPFDGRVRDERVDVGQFVSRGASIATIYATDFAEIRLPLADRQLAYLELPGVRGVPSGGEGPMVHLRANFAGTEEVWTGRVVRTEGEIDARSRMVHVIARVEDPYGTRDAQPEESVESEEAEESGEAGSQRTPLAVGMFVRAEIDGRIAKNVLVVPRSAMRDENEVLIVDGEDQIRRRSVEVLRIDRDDVLIRADLGVGERIVVSPIQVIVDGMKVRTIPADGATRS